MKAVTVLLTLAILSGCSGLDIEPISKDRAKNIHTAKNPGSGYLVYHPLVLVEVVNKELCAERTKGNCSAVKNVCGFGQIVYLPDYSKPYLVDSTGGLGKAGIEIEISNGWMLSGFKDNSDNTALLNKLLPDTVAKYMDTDKKSKTCNKTGLYRINDKMKLEEWRLWSDL